MDERGNENVHKPGNQPSEAALLLLTWFLTGWGGFWSKVTGFFLLSLLHPTPTSAPKATFPGGGEALNAVDAVLYPGDVSDQRGPHPLLSYCDMIYRPW